MTQSSSEKAKRISDDSERHGLLGRIIENWLTSVNERQYQLPFCQVLAAEGETILYVSTHGPFEKGKDIVTRTPTGEIRAYQLKAGDIGLSEWRAIYGEIINLVEIPIELPGAVPITEFVPYLVTNGELTDPAIEQVRATNVGWHTRGINKTLHIVQKGALFERFRSSHGAYLPHDLSDFRSFLELILRHGAETAEKDKAAKFLEDILPRDPAKESGLNIARAAASVLLLTGYITGPAMLAANHWCVFEYWVLAGAYILYLAEKSGKADSYWQVSFDLCESAAGNALRSLASECENVGNLVQGNPLTDGHVYRSRVTVLLGLLSAWVLFGRVRRELPENIVFLHSFVRTHLRQAWMWGESAVPYLFLVALELEQSGNQRTGERLVTQMIREISSANGAAATGRGFPNPYYSSADALRLNFGLDHLNSEQFLGFSYCIASLIDFLARRWLRQTLARLWFAITRMFFLEYVPANSAEWFRWHSTEGVLSNHLPKEPQSWGALRASAETAPRDNLPGTLVKRPSFAIWFALVYCHRFTPAVAKLIEDAVWESIR